MKLIYSIFYSDIRNSFQRGNQKKYLEFGHSLNDLIGGQIKAGFKITGF